MFKIRVPATTANMGPGFDCIGMALNLYNELSIFESDRFEIEIINRQSEDIPITKDNLIYKTIENFYAQAGKTVPCIKLVQNDAIPAARGLGSSAACIISGLMAANELSSVKLSKDELAQMACKIEGHPDNAMPAVYGGIVVGAMDSQRTNVVKIIPSEDISFATLIPEFSLLTERARSVLPAMYSREDAVFNISRAALFMASMISGDWDNLQTATDDRLHQPYRKQLIPNMDEIFAMAKSLDTKGVFLSGAGPTLIAIIKKDQEKNFSEKMNIYLHTLNEKWEMRILNPDNNGAILYKEAIK